GSVFEHCFLNFVVTNASRIYTHEMVRHRAGTAFSQTSGRYVRNDELNIVVDPILEPIYDLVEEARAYLEDWRLRAEEKIGVNEEKSFAKKKKITSALRRLSPNAQSNELGFSLNIRTLRQTIEARTSEHAEWEIRLIFNQVYDLVFKSYPAIFADAKLELIDGLNQITFKNKKI
ncbi:MAG: FAD-dependent thymidylate synthase, partial [Bdellovibrionota bacterium]